MARMRLMQGAAMSTRDIAVEHYACPYCGAPSGERCRVAKGSTEGRLVPWSHASRCRGVDMGRNEGYEQGHRQGMRVALDLIERRGPDRAAELLKRWLS